MKDFFVSYNGQDKAWSEWIAWQLEAAGYTTIIQAWDFRPGGNFVIDMQRAAEQATRTIAVLSQNYLEALYTQPEWAAAFAQDPTGLQKTLLPVRVQACTLTGLLSQIVYIDLVGKAEDEAREMLLGGLNPGRAKPDRAPGFPQQSQPTGAQPQAPQPTFPVAGSWGERFLSPAEREAILGDVVHGDKRTVNIGQGTYVEGQVDTGGGAFVGHDQTIAYGGSDPEAIAGAFSKLYQALEQQPETMQKNMAKQALNALEEEAKKGERADENKVKQGLEIILAMLPDIGEVAINTFINPIHGLSTVFQKIAQKAKAQQNRPSGSNFR